jgi:hypothetical protein
LLLEKSTSYLFVEVDIAGVDVEVTTGMDPEAELARLDPLDVDALLGRLERLLDLPMRAGDSDCCRRLLLGMYNHKLYSLCLLDE